MQHKQTHADILQLISKPLPLELYSQVVGHLSRQIAGGAYESGHQSSIIDLLIQQLTNRQHKPISCQTQLSILIAHSLQQALDLQEFSSNQAQHALQSLLFDMRLPGRLKLAMQESVSKWLMHLEDREVGRVGSKVKELIDEAIASQTNTRTNDMIELCVMIIQEMVEQAASNQQLDQLISSADLLIALKTLLAKIGFKDERLSYYAQWMLIYTNLVQQVARMCAHSQQPGKQNRIENLMHRSELYSLGVTILQFKGVSHTHNSKVVLCPQQITDCDHLELVQLRIIYFQMLLATHKLASITNCRAFPSQDQQATIIDWTTIGIHCYLKQQPTLPYNMSRVETKYRLQAALLGLYHHLTQEHYRNLQNLIEKGFDLNKNIVISQLQINSYEHFLFQNDTEHFLDIVEDFSSGKAEMATPKAQLSQIITSLVSNVQNFKLQFILMAKFQLQRAMGSYISGFYDGSQSTVGSLSVEGSLLILCLFGRYLAQDNSELIYLRRLLHAQNLARLSQVAIALVFQLSVSLDCDIISLDIQTQSYDAFYLALWTRYTPLRLTALRCLHYFSSEHYYPRHLADVVQLIAQAKEQCDLRELSLAWNIVRTTVESHMNRMQIGWLLRDFKKLIVKQLMEMASSLGSLSGIYSWTALNGVQICLMVVQNIASECLSQSVLEICLQIALLYRHSLAAQIKKQILSLLKAVCTRLSREQRDFPTQLPQVVPLLVRDLSGPYCCQILPILELIVVVVGAKRRPKLLRKIKPILTTISRLFSLQVQKVYDCQSEINQNDVYCYLVIMNRLVQYFGTEIKSQCLYGWVIDCRKLQLRDVPSRLQHRITSFIFACSVYIKEVATFASVLQTVSRQNFSVLEKEIMLDTLEIFFSTSWAVGGIAKYAYLIKLLYLLTTRPIQFQPNTNGQSIEGFVHRSRNLEEFEEQCIKVYLLFKTHKHSLYCYMSAFMEVGIMRQFQRRQVVLYACELLEKDTCMNYRLSRWQLQAREEYKLQLCNPLKKRECFLEDELVVGSTLGVEQQRWEQVEQQRWEQVELICRKMVKRN